MIPTLVILGLVAVLAFWVISIFNKLTRRRITANGAWSDIDVQLKRRYNLIPNLVETVKGYATHERRRSKASSRPARLRSMPPGSSSRPRRRTCSPAHCASCLPCRRAIPT